MEEKYLGLMDFYPVPCAPVCVGSLHRPERIMWYRPCFKFILLPCCQYMAAEGQKAFASG